MNNKPDSIIRKEISIEKTRITRNREKWTKIKVSKSKHSLENCTGCSNEKILRSTLAMIPIKNNKYKQKVLKNALVETAVLQLKTKEIINNLNRDYRKNYRTTFTKQFKETLDLPDVKRKY